MTVNLLFAFLHVGAPTSQVHLVTTSRWKIKGSDFREIQRLRVRRWLGLSSGHKAKWFIGWISWTKEDPRP